MDLKSIDWSFSKQEEDAIREMQKEKEERFINFIISTDWDLAYSKLKSSQREEMSKVQFASKCFELCVTMLRKFKNSISYKGIALYDLGEKGIVISIEVD